MNKIILNKNVLKKLLLKSYTKNKICKKLKNLRRRTHFLYKNFRGAFKKSSLLTKKECCNKKTIAQVRIPAETQKYFLSPIELIFGTYMLSTIENPKIKAVFV